MRIEISLQEVLVQALQLPWDHHLYLEIGKLSLQQKALLLNDDDEDERDSFDEPLYATSRNFKYFLCMQDVQSVVENAQIQTKEPNIDQLFDALKYYYENDAFLVVSV